MIKDPMVDDLMMEDLTMDRLNKSDPMSNDMMDEDYPGKIDCSHQSYWGWSMPVPTIGQKTMLLTCRHTSILWSLWSQWGGVAKFSSEDRMVYQNHWFIDVIVKFQRINCKEAKCGSPPLDCGNATKVWGFNFGSVVSVVLI